MLCLTDLQALFLLLLSNFLMFLAKMQPKMFSNFSTPPTAKHSTHFIWKISLSLDLWQIPSQMVFLYLFNALIGSLFSGDQA